LGVRFTHSQPPLSSSARRPIRSGGAFFNTRAIAFDSKSVLSARGKRLVVLGEEAALQAHERDLGDQHCFKSTGRFAFGFSSEGAHDAPARRVVLTVGRQTRDSTLG